MTINDTRSRWKIYGDRNIFNEVFSWSFSFDIASFLRTVVKLQFCVQLTEFRQSIIIDSWDIELVSLRWKFSAKLGKILNFFVCFNLSTIVWNICDYQFKFNRTFLLRYRAFQQKWPKYSLIDRSLTKSINYKVARNSYKNSHAFLCAN